MQSKLKNLNEYSTTPCAIAKKKYIFSNNKRYFSCIKGSDVDLLKTFRNSCNEIQNVTLQFRLHVTSRVLLLCRD